jgi:hypothetical protein
MFLLRIGILCWGTANRPDPLHVSCLPERHGRQWFSLRQIRLETSPADAADIQGIGDSRQPRGGRFGQRCSPLHQTSFLRRVCLRLGLGRRLPKTWSELLPQGRLLPCPSPRCQARVYWRTPLPANLPFCRPWLSWPSKKTGLLCMCCFCQTKKSRPHEAAGWLSRHTVQFHWHNDSYSDFEHFLSAMNQEKRKKIKQERRKVSEAGVTLQSLRRRSDPERRLGLFLQMLFTNLF